jgi:hypothetical protein
MLTSGKCMVIHYIETIKERVYKVWLALGASGATRSPKRLAQKKKKQC